MMRFRSFGYYFMQNFTVILYSVLGVFVVISYIGW